MCHNRTLNYKINRLHKRCQCLKNNNNQELFDELFDKEDPIPIYIRNLQTFATEMYKVANSGSPEIMREIFTLCEENIYSLGHQNTSSEVL